MGYVQQTLCQAVEASAKQIPNICRTHMEDLEKNRLWTWRFYFCLTSNDENYVSMFFFDLLYIYIYMYIYVLWFPFVQVPYNPLGYLQVQQ